MAPPRPPRTKIKHFHGHNSEDIEAGLGEKLNTVHSRFKKARFKKESRFKKDCWCNRFFST